MKRFYVKVTLFGLLALFCVMFGVSLASSGVARISGPIGQAGAAVMGADGVRAASANGAGTARAKAGAQANGEEQATGRVGKAAVTGGKAIEASGAGGEQTAKGAGEGGKSKQAGKMITDADKGAGVGKESGPAAAGKDAALNQVGNKLGDLLQIMAHHSIRAFIGLFDAVLSKG
ncbi:hypothetical protein B5M42_006460 [Paenibacillus athensensis]|uniref:Uncharacterized protein n=1 Tax=Paenibacillus athensensis TaxID=1967502 RepID=A0A4Y8Q4T4_9BACL|nr:hypothetical protein [Paenibacillus athensensis]MCD1258483.1 hypothetical protein [Paenibacillus athensensis]